MEHNKPELSLQDFIKRQEEHDLVDMPDRISWLIRHGLACRKANFIREYQIRKVQGNLPQKEKNVN